VRSNRMRTWVERTVVLRRTERYEESSIEAEPGNAVTYALCGLRRGDPKWLFEVSQALLADQY